MTTARDVRAPLVPRDLPTPRPPHSPDRSAPVRRRDFPGSSRQSKLLAQAIRMSVRPLLGLWGRSTTLPWPTGLLDAAGALLPAIDGTVCAPVQLPNCTGSWVEGPRTGFDRVMLYLHGGGFLCGGMRSHLRLVSRISDAGRTPVLMVDYRMLPKHSIDDAVDDGVEGYLFLLAAGYRPDQIVIAGDSAGGYLAFMVSLALRDRGVPVPGAIVALSPLTELDPARKLGHSNAAHCALLPGNALEALAGLAGRRQESGRICPADADLSGMPPTLIQVGSHELFLVDAESMADRLADAGIACELQVWDRQVHVFQAAADLLPEGVRAIGEIGRFVRSAVPGSR
ncbi:alpha/beta hydrolase [Rhodococcus rhodochrous]|uniref:alpha/beta hydrolase n=1 Tax=Rhodococcus rhodochrous TaxID=1829 RepID=UPI0032E01D42